MVSGAGLYITEYCNILSSRVLLSVAIHTPGDSPQCRVSKCPPGPLPGDCSAPRLDTEFTRGPVSLPGARSPSRDIYSVHSVDSVGIVSSVV